MGQTLTINEANTLVSDYLDEVWEAEDPPETVYDKIMKVTDMPRGQHVDYRMAGLGPLVENAELEDIDYDDVVFGEKLTITDRKWARGFRVSDYVLEDLADAGGMNIDSELAAKLGTYADIVRRWKRSGHWVVERECADRLQNGTSTATKYVLRDAIAWFGTHATLKNPTISQTNLATHQAMSANSIDAMITTVGLQLDDRGDYLSDTGGVTVVASQTDRSRLYEILKTKGQVDSANNNVNKLDQYDIKPVVNRYLNLQAASYSGYFVLASGHSFKWLWRKKISFGQDTDFDANAKKYKARMRGEGYVKDWRGSIGDNGS